MPIKEIGPKELMKLIKSNEGVVLIDVRESWEYGIIRIKESKLIPVNELSSRLYELDEEKRYVFYCRTGHRSKVASAISIGNVKEAMNLKGGILECYNEGIDKLEIIDREKLKNYF